MHSALGRQWHSEACSRRCEGTQHLIGFGLSRRQILLQTSVETAVALGKLRSEFDGRGKPVASLTGWCWTGMPRYQYSFMPCTAVNVLVTWA